VLVIFLDAGTIINFLVITKGAERVAEVAARFTLDAMPGKQMSIDADCARAPSTSTRRGRRATTSNRESSSSARWTAR
jgi:type III secretion protein V